EDGIRDRNVTGVQTCALPIFSLALRGGSLELASEEVGPVGDIRVATQQGAALTLRHATPDTELHLVIEGIGAALQNDGAVTADSDSLALRCTLHKELFCVHAAAVRVGTPFTAILERLARRQLRHSLTHGLCCWSGLGAGFSHSSPPSWI